MCVNFIGVYQSSKEYTLFIDHFVSCITTVKAQSLDKNYGLISFVPCIIVQWQLKSLLFF
jgi:hypothetical protein